MHLKFNDEPAVAEDRELILGEQVATHAAQAIPLDEVAPLLASPDSSKPLLLASDRLALVVDDESFPIRNGIPLLLPAKAQAHIRNGRIDIALTQSSDPFLQYLLISSIKQIPLASNSPHDDVWYRRHLYRARMLFADVSGTMLDIGCDDPDISRSVMPPSVQYIGLDPIFADLANFRLIGMAEFLPFRGGSLDNVAFMTSLDHVLDYHRAIDEAHRVLKRRGRLHLATLVWTDAADLQRDAVHFHHFREYEIVGALAARFSIEQVHRYIWKNDMHRHGIYLSASKV